LEADVLRTAPLVLFAVLAMWLALSAQSQQATTRVTGTVLDAEGRPLEGASVPGRSRFALEQRFASVAGGGRLFRRQAIEFDGSLVPASSILREFDPHCPPPSR
jgi:hypothetical protein